MRAAYRIASALTDTEIISMRCDPAEVPAADADIIGFVFPVYFWTMPEAAVRFIKELKINPGAYIFGISTLAAINGHSFEMLDRLLRQKGSSLSYGRTLHSVGNSMVTYSPMPFPKLWVPRTEKRLTVISAEIAKQKFRKYPRASALIRMMYSSSEKYTNMLHEADRGFVVTNKCVGCGTCTKVCPCNNILMKDGKPSFMHQCNFCMSCVGYCPKKAINYKVSPEMKEKYPFIRNFNLTEKRKRYHNPHVSIADISADRNYIE
ncbi:EFR1 family ferrodoxin [Caproiciproducens sp. AGMB10547]|uniref:EFR1 family ferrodoxin n=2 Tax=Caproiciproducens faecalis TaxID=2820301 RepID=A0ABS7DLB8_9FIRM|nr:EFR1 family ferrodoxin [Caproiciproducens faecalis]